MNNCTTLDNSGMTTFSLHPLGVKTSAHGPCENLRENIVIKNDRSCENPVKKNDGPWKKSTCIKHTKTQHKHTVVFFHGPSIFFTRFSQGQSVFFTICSHRFSRGPWALVLTPRGWREKVVILRIIQGGAISGWIQSDSRQMSDGPPLTLPPPTVRFPWPVPTVDLKQK